MTSSSACSRTRRALPLLLASALVFAGSGASPDPEAALDALQARYDGVRDIRAEFEQRAVVAALGREEVSRGRVVVARPGRMRWEYTEPAQSVIVVEGDAIRMYDPLEKKLQIVPLASGALSPTALGFLLGEARLRETFSVAPEFLAGPGERDDELGLRLVPKGDAGFEWVELRLARGSYQLRESVLLDLFGNRTQIRFQNIVENQGSEEVAFTIRVPDDTEIIDLR